MTSSNFSFIKNKALLNYPKEEIYAFATYTINSRIYSESIIEEIALGQSIGAWETSYVSEEILNKKVAKLVHYEKHEDHFHAKIAFPLNLWHGNLSWLLTILFGKMSFYPGIQLSSVEFSKDIPLTGPKNSLTQIREKLNAPSDSPLLMGILKPNVAMSPEQICMLYIEAAEAGVQLLKDDEIRFDEDEKNILKRIELIANEKAKRNLKTIYIPHLQIDKNSNSKLIKQSEEAGADAFLINSWLCGLDSLQDVRSKTNLPLFSHPALVGAFSFANNEYSIHPRVSLAQLIRAAGADFSLFPSPYGKLGLPKKIALEISHHCLETNESHFTPMTPVPSAGIKPEHCHLAKEDFGSNFVLNAGTGIFSGPKSIAENISDFKKNLFS